MWLKLARYIRFLVTGSIQAHAAVTWDLEVRGADFLNSPMVYLITRLVSDHGEVSDTHSSGIVIFSISSSTSGFPR